MDEIRLAKASDAVEIAEIYGRVVATTSISFEEVPPSEADFRARIESVLGFAPWLVFTRKGEVLGYVYASRHRERASYRWSVDVAVYIREDARGQGIGRVLYQRLFAALKLQGFFVAHAGVTLPNPGSLALHKSFGFREVGVYPNVAFKNGQWHDVIWMQMPLREPSGIPQEPNSMAELLRDPAWAQVLLP